MEMLNISASNVINVFEIENKKYAFVLLDKFTDELNTKEGTDAREAYNSLSYTEKEVSHKLFTNFKPGIINIVQLADKLNLSESVIRMMFGKLESRKIIEKQNLGRKGTYVILINKQFEKFIASKI